MSDSSSVPSYEMARSFEDRLQALQLIHLAYVRANLSEESEEGLRVTKHQLLAQSRIFVSKINGEIATTLSLIPDSRAGLPLEEIYPRQVNQLRDRELRIAEVGCFADRRNDPKRFMQNFCALTRVMAHYSFLQGIDGFIIAVHPRHARFYKKFLCFEEVGGLADYPTVKNNPAVALFLHFERAQQEEPVRYPEFIGPAIAAEEFENGEMPRWEAAYFTRVLEAQGSKVVEGSMIPPLTLSLQPTDTLVSSHSIQSSVGLT